MNTAPKLGDSPEDVIKSIKEEYRSAQELGLVPSDRRALCEVVSTAIAQAQEAGKDVSEAAVAAARAFRAGLQVDETVLAYKNYAPANCNNYTGDDYPRAGCTVVVQLTETLWHWIVYAPGYAPGGVAGIIESFGRPLGSAGIALDGFIRGVEDKRALMPAMIRAERDYAAASESDVTPKV